MSSTEPSRAAGLTYTDIVAASDRRLLRCLSALTVVILVAMMTIGLALR